MFDEFNTAAHIWNALDKPFTLERPDQFRAPAPPDLKSPEWAKDYNEIKTVGGTASTVRTAEQTDIAKFWTSNTVVQYNTAFKAVIDGCAAPGRAHIYPIDPL